MPAGGVARNGQLRGRDLEEWRRGRSKHLGGVRILKLWLADSGFLGDAKCMLKLDSPRAIVCACPGDGGAC